MAADVVAVLRPPALRLVNGGAPHKVVRTATAMAGKGDLAAVQAAVADQPTLLHQRGPDGVTLVWAASAKGRDEVVRWALAEGASPHTRGSTEHATGVLVSPLAVAKGAAVADQLTAAGAGLDLFDLCWLGRTDEVASILDVDPGAVTSTCPEDDLFPITPLHYAVDGDRLDTVRLLLGAGRRGRALQPAPPGRRRPAGLAAHRRGPGRRRGGRRRGRDPRADRRRPVHRPLPRRERPRHQPPGPRARSFLTMACRGDKGKRIGTVRALLDLGADPTIPDGFGTTAVEMAERSNFSEALDLFT